jgi:hypothetical protein
MRENTKQVVSLPATTSQDVLPNILRDGAQRMLTQAIDAEIAEAFIILANVDKKQWTRSMSLV